MDPPIDLQGRINAEMLTGFRDELVREAGIVTPGVDDTPYIQFAIEALTKDRDTGYSGNESLNSGETLSGHRALPDQGLGSYQPTSPTQQRRNTSKNEPQSPGSTPWTHLHHDRFSDQSGRVDPHARLSTRLSNGHPQFDFGFSPQARAAAWNNGAMLAGKGEPIPMGPGETVPTDRGLVAGPRDQTEANRLPPLRYKPWLLRSTSFTTLLLLCTLMVAALIFCAVYSASRDGLVAYAASSGQYFLFRILAQLLAAVIVVYTQCVVAAMFRILPFVRLASEKSEERERAIYMDLYPGHMLWPKLMDKWEMWMFVFISWLINLTLPLQSALFTPILVDGVWKWGTVQGVAWTLVALYIVLMVSTMITLIEWAKITQTGLIWDPRSLADIVVMLSDTNVAAQYKGTELASHRSTIGFALRHRNIEKLGYWSGVDGRAGTTYAIRSFEADHPRGSGHTANEKTAHLNPQDYAYDRDLEASTHRQAVRYAYLPWCLRSSPLVISIIAATLLLTALFIISFLPSTQLSSGFPPLLPTAPEPGAFSPADFLYSFLPSLLGLLLHLHFQSLDISFRTLQPWATLSHPSGTPARRSLLADYPAALPVQASLHALRNSHYRVAALSLLSTLFVFLPVLGGGLFIALSDTDGAVRVYPCMPVFALALALLLLYLGGLVAAVPHRRRFRMPHGVGCLAEVVGFLVNGEVLREGCFRGVWSKRELEAKMGVGRGEDGGRWVFVVGGRDGMLGVRRVERYTARRGVRKSQIRRGT